MTRCEPRHGGVRDDVEPSLTTILATGRPYAEPRGPAPQRSGAPGSSSNTVPAISTSSPGSNPAALQRLDHAHRAEAVLEVAQSLVVAQVMAGNEALDVARPPPGSLPRAGALHRERLRPPRGGRRGGWPPPARGRFERLAIRRVGPLPATRVAQGVCTPAPVAAEVTTTPSTSLARGAARATPALPRPRPLSACTRSALERAEDRGKICQAGVRGRAARPPRWRGWPPGRCRPVGARSRHVHQQAAALHVREELVAEAGALAGALDQPRDVGQHQLAVLGLDHAEHGLEVVNG